MAGPLKLRSQDELAYLREQLGNIRPVNPRSALIAVFNVLGRHLPRGQSEKIRDALPDDMKARWRIDEANEQPIAELASKGKEPQNAQAARTFESRPEGQRKRG